ncbi:hypothetical protein B0H67DRAFT_641141 [Lasiosphaeris hirsuta]|uniref:Altered inheritance of mitochondria protein 9, mitochondrial n=1 Tax=Lasiosphaeris hirsuta TaxID=260670 RepID=A0AA40AZ44_9PEZI|nr:hypothetical protein B0H67DRAFT_641141 [Lasiosphaeris hirsuta]
MESPVAGCARLGDEVPPQLQPSAPRQAADIKRVQDRWMRWTRDPQRHDWTFEWTAKPTICQAKDLVDFYLDRGADLGIPKHLIWEYFTVRHFRQGRSNQLFLVEFFIPTYGLSGYSTFAMIMRLGVPKDPFYLVESEVATMCFARRSGLPVPRVYSFDSSGANPLELEPIFMELVPGVNFKHWICDSGKDLKGQDLIKILDEVQNKHLTLLEKTSFDQIGSLYYDWKGERGFFVGPSTAKVYWTGYRAQYVGQINRGPFDHITASLDSYLCAWEVELSDTRVYPKDRAHVRDLYHARTLITETRRQLLPRLHAWGGRDAAYYIQGLNDTVARTAWHRPHVGHGSLHHENLLIDPDTLKVTAIVDWEKSTVQPGPASPSMTYYLLWDTWGLCVDSRPPDDVAFSELVLVPTPKDDDLPGLIRVGEKDATEYLDAQDGMMGLLLPPQLQPPKDRVTGVSWTVMVLEEAIFSVSKSVEYYDRILSETTVALDSEMVRRRAKYAAQVGRVQNRCKAR